MATLLALAAQTAWPEREVFSREDSALVADVTEAVPDARDVLLAEQGVSAGFL